MALAVASTSSVATNNAATLTITKPTGVAVGDLLVIIAAGKEYDDYPTSTGFTQQITKQAGVSGLNAHIQMSFLWKIADSGDVSAANYTINLEPGAEQLGAAAMYRITGWSSGNPVWFSDTSAIDINTIPKSLGASVSATRPTASSIAIISSAYSSYTTDRNPTWASHSITSGVANPSWTEVIDSEFETEGSGTNKYQGFVSAYSTATSTSTITAWDTQISTGATTGHAATIFVVIVEPQNVAADVGHLAVTPTLFGLSVSHNASASIGHLEVTPTINGLSTVNSTDDTQWTNPDKPSTTWTNPNK